MMPKLLQSKDSFFDLHFPRCGIDVSMGFGKQPNRPMGDGNYARTAPAGNNVRAFDPISSRGRGSSRCGIVPHLPNQVNGSYFVQNISLLAGLGFQGPGGQVQISQSGRVVTLVAVAGGNIFAAAAGDTVWSTTFNHTGYDPPLNASGLIFSAANNQKLWFADGSNWVYYVPATNSVETWVANQGTLPVDSAGNTPRLITTWRGRTVVSGLLFDGQNWFMSRVSDPQDFDYGPVSTSPTQAVAGNNSQLGFVGDLITALIPFTDDVLIFGGDHTIWMMNGDPMAGGQLDLLSDSIGIAWNAWCKDPFGAVYFVSNRTGIYRLTPGQGPPQRISQAIEQLLEDIDTGTNTISMVWEDRFQGLHVFVTPTAAAAPATHYFWEMRSNAWWTDSFLDPNHNPLCTCVFDGNLPGDRVALIGSWDGYVRRFDPGATTDDGKAIVSSVILGPLLTAELDEMLVKEFQAILGETSNDVTFEVMVGRTAEEALSSQSVVSGIWTAGRNFANLIRRSGHAVYVRVSCRRPWAIEALRVRLAPTGKVRRRYQGR